MGREIYDSGRSAAHGQGEPGPSPALGGGPAVPVFELEPVDGHPAAGDSADLPGSARSVRSQLGRLRHDAGHRRRVIRFVVAGVALVALTAVAVDARNGQAATRAAESQLAVDIRVDQVPGVQDASSGAQTIRGDSSLDVKLHNLGPRPVRLTEVLYVLGQGGRTGRMLATDVSVRPGERMDRAFHVVLPCGSTRETAVPEGPAALMAKIRTTDGATHTVPVDLSALDELGGLFVSCNDYRQSALNADSQLVPGGVQVSLDLPTSDVSGAATVVVGLARSGLSARVGFATAPRLPATVPSGTHFTVTIRPVVHACPASLDLTALPAIALSFGDDTYPDPYLPLLVAQAVGRACANRVP